MTAEGTRFGVPPVRPVTWARNEVDEGSWGVYPAPARIDVNALSAALSSSGGLHSPKVSSQSMGVLSRAVFGTLGLGDMTAWGKSAVVEEDEMQLENARSQCCNSPSPTSVLSFSEAHVAIDMSSLEQSMDYSPPSLYRSSEASLDMRTIPTMICTPGPQKASCRVLDEFPDLKLKPIRTRTPVHKPPTIHVTNCQPCGTERLLVPQQVCFGSGIWRMVAQLGTAVGAWVAAVMYVVGIE